MHNKGESMDNSCIEMQRISNSIGIYSQYVQGGGGNTSVKIDRHNMLIKASGFFLTEVTNEKGFVGVLYDDILNKIDNITEKTKDEDEKLSSYIMSKRTNIGGRPFNDLRPSIETGFHALLNKYVIHSHSVYTNILNCSLEGRDILNSIFSSDEYIYIEYHSPGLGLTLAIRNTLAQFKLVYGKSPSIIFLENHGVIVSDDKIVNVTKLHEYVNSKIKTYFNMKEDYPESSISRINDDSWYLKNKYITDEIQRLNITEDFFNKSILFPDQVVYFDNNISFENNSLKRINIVNDQIIINTKSTKELHAIEETLLAYIFILSNISRLKLNFRFIGKQEKEYIENMESEKYRKSTI